MEFCLRVDSKLLEVGVDRLWKTDSAKGARQSLTCKLLRFLSKDKSLATYHISYARLAL